MSDTDWTQIKVRTTSDHADTIADILEQLGALAVSYTDAEDTPILEAGVAERRLWPNTEVTGLLDRNADGEDILKKIKSPAW